MGRMEEHFKGFGIKSLTEVYSVPRLGGTVLVECGQWFSEAPSMFNPQNLYLEDRCSYTNMLAFPLYFFPTLLMHPLLLWKAYAFLLPCVSFLALPAPIS